MKINVIATMPPRKQMPPADEGSSSDDIPNLTVNELSAKNRPVIHNRRGRGRGRGKITEVIMGGRLVDERYSNEPINPHLRKRTVGKSIAMLNATSETRKRVHTGRSSENKHNIYTQLAPKEKSGKRPRIESPVGSGQSDPKPHVEEAGTSGDVKPPKTNPEKPMPAAGEPPADKMDVVNGGDKKRKSKKKPPAIDPARAKKDKMTRLNKVEAATYANETPEVIGLDKNNYVPMDSFVGIATNRISKPLQNSINDIQAKLALIIQNGKDGIKTKSQHLLEKRGMMPIMMHMYKNLESLHPHHTIHKQPGNGIQLSAVKLPFVPFHYIQQFMRQYCTGRKYERPCVKGDKCQGKTLPVYTSNSTDQEGFVLREFLLPDVYAAVVNNNQPLPVNHQMCILCLWYFTSSEYQIHSANEEETNHIFQKYECYYDIEGEYAKRACLLPIPNQQYGIVGPIVAYQRHLMRIKYNNTLNCYVIEQDPSMFFHQPVSGSNAPSGQV
jgi:hypothetical protein